MKKWELDQAHDAARIEKRGRERYNGENLPRFDILPASFQEMLAIYPSVDIFPASKETEKGTFILVPFSVYYGDNGDTYISYHAVKYDKDNGVNGKTVENWGFEVHKLPNERCSQRQLRSFMHSWGGRLNLPFPLLKED